MFLGTQYTTDNWKVLCIVKMLGVLEISVFSSQFCCELKTALK